nr:SH3 domain-containing protein [Chloroflexia bacterium]
GWASAEFLTRDGAPAPVTGTPGGAPGGAGTARVNTGTLNLRSGPATSFAVLKRMYQNETVRIVSGPSNGWYQITSGTTTGWASAMYLALGGGSGTPPPTSAPTTPPVSAPTTPPAGSGTATVDADTLNLRSTPSTSGAIIARMPMGETVRIISTGNGWYQVDFRGRIGWASGTYLKVGGGGTSAPSDSASFWVPVHQQLHPLSCEYASLQIATEALGRRVDEDRFIPVVGQNANPHYGFRGDIDATYVFGLTNYGVYPEALAKALPTFGFTGEVFYGGPERLKTYLRASVPVVVWLDFGYTTSIKMDINGESVTMAPRSHVVVAYGFDSQGVQISDPDSSNRKRLIPWSNFNAMWASMDQMALAVRG